MNAMIATETPRDAARRLSAGVIRDGFKPEALHRYNDADGWPWCYRIRCKHPNGDKWIRPMRHDGARYMIGEPPAPANGKPLYVPPYPLIVADPVVIVEGEPCADALARLGMNATTSGAADSANAADWTPLCGRTCIVWPDNDTTGKQAGRLYGETVVAKLRTLGCTVEVIDVAALDLPDKGDCVDWIAAHPDATAADVLELPRIAASPDTAIAASTTDNMPRIELRCGADIVCRPIRWLWPGWLARGKLHILAGAPGTGKTTIALALAAAVTSGGRWPSGTHAPVGNVLIWSGEDDAADTIMPRLKAAGVDVSRIFIVGDYRAGDDARPFDPANDMDLLEQAAARIGNVVLLIADPVVSAVAGDSHKNTEVRRALQPIVDLAARLDAAVIGISHFSKGSAGKEPTERVTGSIAFGAIARVVMVTAKHTDADGRLLARAKSNIGPDGGGFAYELEQTEHDGLSASVVRWGASLDGSARDLLGDAEQDDTDHDTRDASDWLRELLADGPLPVKDVRKQCEDAGHAWRTVQRAMRAAGVESKRGGFGMPATWSLASRATVAPVAPTKLLGANGANGESLARLDDVEAFDL